MKRHYMILLALLFSTPVASDPKHQPYKGFETRSITSLSQADIDALETGGGWGLALPAELNGYPGPLHVLELAEELGLSEPQKIEVQGIYDAMRADAVAKGVALIEAERQLDLGFTSGVMTPMVLQDSITAAERARAALRFVHLSSHLAMIEVLSEKQISEYAILRGYGSDPCQSVPEGHDADMWRRHNGCEG